MNSKMGHDFSENLREEEKDVCFVEDNVLV